MPYSTNSDLPDNVKSSLPERAQTVFRTVFNARIAAGKSEDVARASAWTAVKNGWKKDDGEWVRKAEYQGRKVELDKPFRTPGEPKKFAVYVKDGDRVKIVRFGDPDMEIRRDDEQARANFRSRHSCDTATDKTSARYWSCRMWSDTDVSDIVKVDPLYKSAPKPLYVSRKLKNGKALIAWAKSQGIETTVPENELHVTILYSKTPTDWFAAGSGWQPEVTVDEGGPRTIERFGEDAIVLRFACQDFKWRHSEFIELAGASHDWPEYAPHVTITYDGANVDLEKIEPYQGELVFGPEIFQEIEEENLVEKEFLLRASIAKTDEEKRLVFGLFNVVNKAGEQVVDLEDDSIAAEELEKAAYNYVRYHRDASVNHRDLGVADLVESMMFTKEKVDALKKALTAAGIPHTIEIDGEFWWGGHFVKNDEVWAGVKSGDYESWSIGGSGTRKKNNG